jgi:hypothetical protein
LNQKSFVYFTKSSISSIGTTAAPTIPGPV